MKMRNGHAGRLAVLLCLLCCGSLMAATNAPRIQDESAPPAENGITLEIECDGEVQQFGPVEVAEKITVYSLMKRIAKDEAGFKFEFRGRDATVFITSIQNRANEGAGGHNWLYEIDGELAKQGVGVQKVGAGQTIRWRFRKR